MLGGFFRSSSLVADIFDANCTGSSMEMFSKKDNLMRFHSLENDAANFGSRQDCQVLVFLLVDVMMGSVRSLSRVSIDVSNEVVECYNNKE